jgi:fibronectin-binding autotransporter adhesin
MSKRLNHSLAIGIFLIGLLSANISQAQIYTNLYWNPTTNGLGGSGTWTTSGALWSTNSSGGGTLQAPLTSTSNIYNFSGTVGTVTGSAGLTVGGMNWLTSDYTLTSSANVTYIGTDATLTGTNTVYIANNANLNITGAGVTLNGLSITGGAGSTLTLTNAAGATTALIMGNSNLKSGRTNSVNTIIAGAGTIVLGSQAGTTGYTQAGNIVNNSTGTFVLTNNASGTVTVSGVISGSGGLALNNTNTGRIQLLAANNYSGGTTLNNTGTGTISISNSAAFGTGTITSAGAVTNYVRAEASALNIANNWQIDSGSILRLGATTSGWNVTASGVIAGAGSMVFSNSGINSYLTGTNNSFGGGVNVGNGTLYFNKIGSNGVNSSLGTSGTITVGGPSATTTGGLRWNGTTNETSDKTIVLSGTTGGLGLYAEGATGSSLTINGNINSTGAGAKTLNIAGLNSNTLAINGVINENGGVNSVVIGSSQSGTVVLGNANNSFSGAIRITNSSSSTLTVLSTANIGNSGLDSALGRNGTINMAGTSASAITALKYTGTGETSDKVINFMSGVGSAILDQSGTTGNLKFTSAMTATGVGAKAITLQGSTAGTGEIAGAISDLGGLTSLTKSGSGTWTLSGNNTYTGTTTFGGGTNIISGDNSAAVGNVTISGGATYVRLENSSAISSSSSLVGMGGTIAQSSTLDFKAVGNVTLNSYGVSSSSAGGSMNFTNSSGISKTVTFTNADNYITQASSGLRGLSIKSADLTLDFVGNIQNSSTQTSTTTFDGAGNFIVRGSLLDSTNATGIRTIAKTGAGTLTLRGASNNYSGSTLVSGGTLEVGASGALPVATSITVSNGATLRFNQASGGINVGSLTNAGTLEQNLITITSSGAVNLSGSTLKVNGTPTLASYTLVSGAPLTGTPTLSGANGYQLIVDSTSVKLVKTVVPTGSTFDTTYAAGTEQEVGSNGLTKLMNYSLGGTGPTSSPALPVLTSDANGLTLTANIRNDDASGLNVIGQYAYSLEGPWIDVTPLNPTGATSSVDKTTVRGFSRPFEENQPRVFMRFQTTK